MDETEFRRIAGRIAGLFEELDSIIKASSVGSGREPVWDGTVIGKPNQHTLVKMGLLECCHGYYFPTEEGMRIYKMFFGA